MPPHADSTEIIFAGQQIRCVLGHDHVLLRKGLRRLLEDVPDIEVVGEAGNGAECLRKVNDLRPEVLVADAAMFGLPAPEVELRVAGESPQTKVVFLTAHEHHTLPAMDSRSPSWAVRDTSAEELLDMIRNSRRDKRAESISGYAVPPSPASSSLAYRDALPTRNRLSSASPFLHERVLTSREREVLKLLAEGKTVRATATVLGLSRKTVDAHKFNLMRKLGIHNKAQLVMWAIQKKVVKVPVNF